MRIYIIGSDGITLCGEPPAVVNEGEIVVASARRRPIMGWCCSGTSAKIAAPRSSSS